MSDTTVTSTLSGAAFNNGNPGPDGDTFLNGTFTAVYDSSGNLISIENVDVTESGSYGSYPTVFETYEGATISSVSGTYAITLDDPAPGQTANYGSLTTLDWMSEIPSTIDPASYVEAGYPLVQLSDASGGSITNTVIVTNSGSTVSAGGDNAGNTIDFDGTITGSSFPTPVLTVDSFGIGDSLVISASDYPSGTVTDVEANFIPGANILLFSEIVDGQSYFNDVALNLTSNATSVAVTIDPVTDNIDVTAMCFYPGTSVRTPNGQISVETLKAGDIVTLSDGRTAPISWLGRQTVSVKFADPMRVLPVRIKANALGESLPARDLLISPDHAILVDNILVQAGALVNGVSVVRETNVPETFTYYHVEVADHSLVLAENLAAETFVDNVDRMGFDNWDEHVALGADTITEMEYPRARSARQVPAAIRARLLARGQALYGADIAVAA